MDFHGLVAPLDHENPYKVKKKIDTCHVTPGGPWKGFSCYQIPQITLYGMYLSVESKNLTVVNQYFQVQHVAAVPD